MKKKIIILGLFSAVLFAGGDNRVTMTDMKEALTILIDKSVKNEKDLGVLERKVVAIEPFVALTDRNSVDLRNIQGRLNELGVVTNPNTNNLMWNDIRKFIGSNKGQFPLGANN